MVINYICEANDKNSCHKKNYSKALIVENNIAKSFSTEMNKGLVKKIEQNMESNSLMAYATSAFHTPYIRIDNGKCVQTPDLKISRVNSKEGVYLSTVEGNQYFEDFLLENFLGQYISIHYAQSNSKQLLEKFLLEKEICFKNGQEKIVKL